MKTISILLYVKDIEFDESILKDNYNIDYSYVEVYCISFQQIKNKLIKNNYVVSSENEAIKVIGDLLTTLDSDYLLIMNNCFYFHYDDAILDSIRLSDTNKITCFSTNYLGDLINKFDIHYKNQLINPSLSDIINHPSAFVACIYPKKIYNNINFIGNNFVEAQVNFLITSIMSGYKCEFSTWHILQTKLKTCEFESQINKEDIISSFLLEYPLFKRDYLKVLNNISEVSVEDELVLNKFKNTIFFKILMKLRLFLKKIGYYNIKSSVKSKRYLRKVRIEDEQRKLEIEKKIESLPYNMLKRNNDETDIVVSLTTHGKRLAESAPYGIYSLFTQTVLPNRIILNINKDVWNISNLPPLIKRLMQSGLEVNFCNDVRSHTKFIPTLQNFPNNVIITVDDDMCYNKFMIEELISAYQKSDKKTIFCRQGVIPKRKNGKFLPYMQWDDTINLPESSLNKYTQFVSPYGVHGVLYPPHIFDGEIFKNDIFLKIAPHTDDIWFWLMEVRSNIPAVVISQTMAIEDSSVSLLEYLIETESSALYFQNCFNGRNDKEMYALLDYYKIE